MKRLALGAIFALALGCRSPMGPDGIYKMVTICTYTIGVSTTLDCAPIRERCWYTFADNTYHCPSGTYTPANKPGTIREEP